MNSSLTGEGAHAVSGTHRASMTDVAAKAGVSHQTVSRVINNSPNVSEATRARVQKVIHELNYRPSNSARALATQHTKTIGFIAGGVNYYGPISTMGAIESVAREHGFYLSVAILDEREYTPEAFESVADSFLGQGVEAFVFLAPTEPMVRAVLSASITQPCVILTSLPEPALTALRAQRQSGDVRVVSINQYSAALSVVDYLNEEGHRSCVFFAGPRQWTDAQVREKAWKDRSASLGWNSQVLHLNTWDASEAYEAALKRFGQKRELPTAIVTSNDLQAFGVCKALSELGIHVPADVSVVGFDDMPGSDFHTPSLTTVRPDFDAVGRRAMVELLAMLGLSTADSSKEDAVGEDSAVSVLHDSGSGDGSVSDGASFVRLIPAELIVRESSGVPRSS